MSYPWRFDQTDRVLRMKLEFWFGGFKSFHMQCSICFDVFLFLAYKTSCQVTEWLFQKIRKTCITDFKWSIDISFEN